MSDKPSRKNLQRILIISSSLALIAVSIVPLLENFRQPSNPNSPTSTPNTNNNNSALNEQLKKEEEGYKSVLKREPDNPIALQGLVGVRVQMNDFQGAKEPTEKLLKLEPDNPGYLQALAQINLKLNDIEGALPPLEKLAKIYPENTEIKTVIDTLKKAQRGELPQQPPSPTTPTTPDPAIPIPIPNP